MRSPLSLGRDQLFHAFHIMGLIFHFPSLSLSQGVSGALSVLMKDAIKPTLMQTLEVS